MSKYLILWEIDASKLPISREERAAAWKPMVEMVKDGTPGYLGQLGDFGHGRIFVSLARKKKGRGFQDHFFLDMGNKGL